MGCMSAYCVLSGLEIKNQQECFVAFVDTSSPVRAGEKFNTPFFHGLYDDYGGVYLLEDYEPYNFKMKDNIGLFDSYQPVHDDYQEDRIWNPKLVPVGSVVNHYSIKGSTVFVHKDVFYLLNNLDFELSFEPNETIGMYIKRLMNEVSVQMEKSQSNYLSGLTSDEERDKRLLNSFMGLTKLLLKAIVPEFSNMWNGFESEIYKKFEVSFSDEKTDWYNFLVDVHYTRHLKIKLAALTLRKNLFPIVSFVQSGNDKVLSSFYEGVLNIQKAKF